MYASILARAQIQHQTSHLCVTYYLSCLSVWFVAGPERVLGSKQIAPSRVKWYTYSRRSDSPVLLDTWYHTLQLKEDLMTHCIHACTSKTGRF